MCQSLYSLQSAFDCVSPRFEKLKFGSPSKKRNFIRNASSELNFLDFVMVRELISLTQHMLVNFSGRNEFFNREDFVYELGHDWRPLAS